ncbi:MAG: hypothetical protein AABX91_01550 [Nanoarchaeota archaeon]
MERRIMLWITIGVLFLVALYFVFQAGGSSSVSQNIGSTASTATSAASSGGMVGGC